jgi:hypothetical protein
MGNFFYVLKSSLSLFLTKFSGFVNGKSVSGVDRNSKDKARIRKNTRIDYKTLKSIKNSPY